MKLDPAPGSAPGLVVCVGLPSDQIIEIAQLLRGRATVLATPDAEGARAVLANQSAPHHGGGPARRGLQPERFENPGPAADQPYGRRLPGDADPYDDSDNPTGMVRTAAGHRSTTLSSPVLPSPEPGTPDAGPADRSGRFRPPSGSPLAPPVLHGTVPAPSAAGTAPPGGLGYPDAGLGRTAARPPTGSVPMIAPPTLDPLVAGPLLVDLAGREVTARGRRVYLSAREFDLLATLALEAGRVWSFAELTARVWQLPYLGDSDPVTSAVKRLRKRLAPVRDVEVASVRGVGYRLRLRA